MTDAPLFEGLRVIDIASFIAAPVAGVVLADFGADVIKIEPPGGDGYRHVHAMPGMPEDTRDYAWQVDNRSKRGLALDLNAPEGQEVLHRLLSNADVLITNFLPRVREKLGLRWEDLQDRYPRLIYASLSAYGEDGPEADRSGFDTTALWARSGMMGLVKPAPESAPARALPGMGDHPTGIALLSGILMGLYQRERTGRGSRVSTSLVAMGLWMNAFYAQASLNDATIPPRPAREEIPNALTNIYQCCDGRWFYLALVNEARQAAPLFEAIGRADLMADPRFADADARRTNASELRTTLDYVFSQRDWQHWQHVLTKAGITYSQVALPQDIPGDSQLRHAGAVIDDVEGRATIGSPVFMDGQRKRAPDRAPGIGDNSREILIATGYTNEEVDQLIEIGTVMEPPS